MSVSCLLGGCSTLSRSSGESPFGMSLKASGMTRIDDRHCLVVNDTMGGAEGPRIGLVDIQKRDLPAYLEVTANWDAWGGPAHDLRSVCAVPGRPDEFLAAESGYENDRYGRVFHFRLERDEQDRPRANIIQTLSLPRLYGRIDSIVVGRTAHDQLVLIIGERGSKSRRARLSWGPLLIDDEHIVFRIVGDLEFRAPWSGDADQLIPCADLAIDAQNRLWGVATIQPGSRGPFRSIIYRLGDFDPQRHRPVLSVNPLKPVWIVEGFRIMAIAESPDDPESLCFISDDVHLGGVWRPLARPFDR
ncbi:MAG: hypothetical protein O7G85_10525 [Planctomycetota bacterium]|nr:hypothetical protein [Planctomycetota bacterium]